jgi:hypothetical protein
LYVLQPKATRTRDLSGSLSLSWERIRERFHITRQRSRLPHGHGPNAEHLVRIILALGLRASANSSWVLPAASRSSLRSISSSSSSTVRSISLSFCGENFPARMSRHGLVFIFSFALRPVGHVDHRRHPNVNMLLVAYAVKRIECGCKGLARRNVLYEDSQDLVARFLTRKPLRASCLSRPRAESSATRTDRFNGIGRIHLPIEIAQVIE